MFFQIYQLFCEKVNNDLSIKLQLPAKLPDFVEIDEGIQISGQFHFLNIQIRSLEKWKFSEWNAKESAVCVLHRT